MTDEDKKKLGNLIKDTVKPLKELVEVLKSKIDHQELYLTTTSSNVKSIKEQQSVVNEKLDVLIEQIPAVAHELKLKRRKKS